MSFVTYHTRSTKSIGGVQFLIRDLQDVALAAGFEVVEIYADEDDDGLQAKDQILYQEIKYRKVGRRSVLRKLNGIFRRLALRSTLRKLERRGGNKSVVCLNNVYDLFFVGRVFLRENYVVVVQTDAVNKFFSPVRLLLFKVYLKYIDSLVVYTEFDKESVLKRLGGRQLDVRVIPRACRFYTAKEAQCYSKKLITICRIEENQKNLSAMMRVMDLLGNEYSLDIYGPGDEQQVSQLKKMMSSRVNVKYHGPTLSVDKALRGASVFIMTSRHEGFGQTLVQARSQGLPVVVFDTFDAAKWIVCDGKTGFLVKPFNIDDFAGKVELILSSQDIYSSFSKNCLEAAKSTEQSEIKERWRKLLCGFLSDSND